MKKTLIFVIILIVGYIYAENNLTVILFDTSKSMIGLGDGNGIDIFDNVKRLTYNNVINRELINQNLMIIPFDEKIKNEKFIRFIKNESQIFQAKKFLNDLKANGNKTYLARSFGETILFLKEFAKSNNISNLKIKLILVTDGRGNGEEDKSEKKLKSFLEKYDLAKSDFDYFFTKIWVIGENVFDNETINLLNKKGIQTFVMDRNQLNEKKIFIQPNNIALDKESGTFNLFIQADPELNDKSLLLEMAYSNYTLTPNTIILNDKIDHISLTANHLTGKPFIDQIKLKIKNDEAKIYVGENFSQNPIINLSSEEDQNRLIVLDKNYSIKNTGKVKLKLQKSVDKPLMAKVKVISPNKEVQFKSKQELVVIKDDEVIVELVPIKPRDLTLKRLHMIKNSIIEYNISLETQNSEYYFEKKPVTIQNKITVNKLNYFAPLLIIGTVAWWVF